MCLDYFQDARDSEQSFSKVLQNARIHSKLSDT